MSVTRLSAPQALHERSFRAIGTTAIVVVADREGADGGAQADQAERMLRSELDALDHACSRFRDDSELAFLHRQGGTATKVSSLLFEALEVAVLVARKTEGAVDPTVGNAISALGYDRDFDEIVVRPLPAPDLSAPVAGFAHIQLDTSSKTVQIPRGVQLDLGSSAKAFGADRAAARIAEELQTGVLVSIGGDVAVGGPPPLDGWAIGIAVDSAIAPERADQVVAIRQGGLASSSTQVRTWVMGTETVHHIIDPTTGQSAAPHWKLVSAGGASCVAANALSTAAVVWGRDAVERLRPFGQAVRLVRHDGAVFTLGGWPDGGTS